MRPFCFEVREAAWCDMDSGEISYTGGNRKFHQETYIGRGAGRKVRNKRQPCQLDVHFLEHDFNEVGSKGGGGLREVRRHRAEAGTSRPPPPFVNIINLLG